MTAHIPHGTDDLDPRKGSGQDSTRRILIPHDGALTWILMTVIVIPFTANLTLTVLPAI